MVAPSSIECARMRSTRATLKAGSHPQTLLLALVTAAAVMTLDQPPQLLHSPLSRPSVEGAEGEAEEEELEGNPLRRAGWFYAQRAYPQRSIPRLARVRAIADLDREEVRLKRLRDSLSLPSVSRDLQVTWQSLGPQPIGLGQTVGTPRGSVTGRVSTIALDPGYDGITNRTVYLGAAQGGIWRSRDDGATWTELGNDLPSLAMGVIAIAPSNPSIIYAGTGEAHLSGDSYFGAGLLKSVDGGLNWTQITGPASITPPQQPAFINAAFSAIAIDPTAPSTLFAATEAGATATAVGFAYEPPVGDLGIWKSSDGGLTWQNMNPAGSLTRPGSDVLIDPRQPRRTLAALRETGIYLSNNGGEVGTWQKLTNGLPASGFYRIGLATGPPLSPSTESTFYAVFARTPTLTTYGTLQGIFRSTDGGLTWTQIGGPPDTGVQLNYNMAIAIDPLDARVIYYGTSTNAVITGGVVWRTLDGGTTWTDISRGDGITGGLHPDTHTVVVSSSNRNILFTGNDGGVWRTSNAMATPVVWTNLNQGLSITQFYSIALHSANPNLLLGGTQDNGVNRYQGEATWFNVRGGDGGATLIDQSNPQVAYHTFSNFNNFGGLSPQIGPEISFDGGNTWARRGCFNCSAQPGGFNPSDRVTQFAPMALHPAFSAQGNVVYFATHRLYRTSDRAVTWTGLGASSDGFGTDLTRGIAPDEFGYSISFISAISAHPVLDDTTNPPGERVWIGTGDGLVQRTDDAGALALATFTNVTRTPLPNRFVTDIAVRPDDRQRALVVYSGFNSNTPGSPGHVFLTSDAGTTWSDVSGNLPDVPVTSAVMDPLLANTYYIGTDLGVFSTSDGGVTWERMANGMPRVAVMMLRYFAPGRSLIAATHGRGVFRASLPRNVVSVSAASYRRDSLAPESIAAAFGADLATETKEAGVVPLPTELAGTRVTVLDSSHTERAASLFFVSAGQVNYLIPAGSTAGPALVTVTSGNNIVSVGTIQIDRIAPGLFSANGDAQGVAAAYALRVKPSGEQIAEAILQLDMTAKNYIPLPIDFGPTEDHLFLILFGTGMRNLVGLSNAKVVIGGIDLPVSHVGAHQQFVGLDQINVELLRGLAGRGVLDIGLTVEGRGANQVQVSFK